VVRLDVTKTVFCQTQVYTGWTQGMALGFQDGLALRSTKREVGRKSGYACTWERRQAGSSRGLLSRYSVVTRSHRSSASIASQFLRVIPTSSGRTRPTWMILSIGVWQRSRWNVSANTSLSSLVARVLMSATMNPAAGNNALGIAAGRLESGCQIYCASYSPNDTPSAWLQRSKKGGRTRPIVRGR
jgi:hypothetical protein